MNSIELPGEIKPNEIVLKQDAENATLDVPLNNAKVVPGQYTIYLTGQVAANFTRNQLAIAQTEKQLADFTAELQAMKATEKETMEKHANLEQQIVALNAKPESDVSQRQAAAAALAEVKKTLDELTPRTQRAEQFRKSLEERLNNIKKQNGPRDAQIVVTSTPVTIEVTKSPLMITSDPPEQVVTTLAEGQIETNVALTVERLYGFSDAIEVSANQKDGHPAVEIASIPKEQNKTVAKFTVSQDTKPGRYEYPVTLKLKFGDVDIQDSTTIVLVVSRPESPEPNSAN